MIQTVPHVTFSWKKSYFKHLVLAHLLDNLVKIHGLRNPFSKFQGIRGSNVNAATGQCGQSLDFERDLSHFLHTICSF